MTHPMPATAAEATPLPGAPPEDEGAAVPGGTADFSDPLVAWSLHLAKDKSLCAYLVALAAFQRGLTVTFHRRPPRADPRFTGRMGDGRSGELFSVSDGDRTVLFNRSLSDASPLQAAVLTRHKHAAKVVLARAGLRVPRGIIVAKGDVEAARDFTARTLDTRFVVKPEARSAGVGVTVDLTAAEAVEAVARATSDRVLVEEFVPGREIRANVVGGAFVAAFERLDPALVGDGARSVAQLLADQAEARKRNLFFGRHPLPVERFRRDLRARGEDLDRIPAPAEVVPLAASRLHTDGADRVDVTRGVNAALAQFCVAACRTLDLTVGGLDVIVSSDPRRPGAYILEANARPWISGHSFPTRGPGQGNRVAEAIIDHHFPSAAPIPRLTRAAFDCAKVVAALQDAEFESVRLPTLSLDEPPVRMTFPAASKLSVDVGASDELPRFAFGIVKDDGTRIVDVHF